LVRETLLSKRTVKGIRDELAGRFREYNEVRKFSVRLVNDPQQI
jgi:hypothetical protein